MANTDGCSVITTGYNPAPLFSVELVYKLSDPFKVGDYMELRNPPESDEPFFWRIVGIEDHGPDGPNHGTATCTGETASRIEVERRVKADGCNVWVFWSNPAHWTEHN